MAERDEVRESLPLNYETPAPPPSRNFVGAVLVMAVALALLIFSMAMFFISIRSMGYMRSEAVVAIAAASSVVGLVSLCLIVMAAKRLLK